MMRNALCNSHHMSHMSSHSTYKRHIRVSFYCKGHYVMCVQGMERGKGKGERDRGQGFWQQLVKLEFKGFDIKCTCICVYATRVSCSMLYLCESPTFMSSYTCRDINMYVHTYPEKFSFQNSKLFELTKSLRA